MAVLVELLHKHGECCFDEYDKASHDRIPCGKQGHYKYGKRFLCLEHGEYLRGVQGCTVIQEGEKW